jgi:hypothetical protein
MRQAILLLIILVCAVPILGCGGGPPPQPHQAAEEWHAPAEMLDRYADKNGVVTRVAMEAGLRADFAKADINHDGCLEPNEARAVNEQRWEEDASAASPLIDFQHNGCIDFDEFAATPRSLFDQLDTNGDGKLTPQELHPGRKPPPPPQDRSPQPPPAER